MLSYISKSILFVLENMHAIYLLKHTSESGTDSDLSFPGIWGRVNEINLRLTKDQFFHLTINWDYKFWRIAALI